MTSKLAVQTFVYWRAARIARGRSGFQVGRWELTTLGEIAVFGATPRLRRAATVARLVRS